MYAKCSHSSNVLCTLSIASPKHQVTGIMIASTIFMTLQVTGFLYIGP